MDLSSVAKSDFKSQALAYFRHIELTGESIIITDHGRPTVEIRKVVPQNDLLLKELSGTVLKYEDPFEPVGLTDWNLLK